MSEINAPATLTTPGGTINFNPTAPAIDYYWLTDVGPWYDQAPLRVTIDDKPQAPGGIGHETLRAVRHGTFEVLVVAGSGVATRGTMCDALLAALESIENADGTWTWTPTGQALKTLTCRCDVGVTYRGGQGGGPKIGVFGLYALNPAIT